MSAPPIAVAILTLPVTALVAAAAVPRKVAGLAVLFASSGPAVFLEVAKWAAFVAFSGVGRAGGSRT